MALNNGVRSCASKLLTSTESLFSKSSRSAVGQYLAARRSASAAASGFAFATRSAVPLFISRFAHSKAAVEIQDLRKKLTQIPEFHNGVDLYTSIQLQSIVEEMAENSEKLTSIKTKAFAGYSHAWEALDLLQKLSSIPRFAKANLSTNLKVMIVVQAAAEAKKRRSLVSKTVNFLARLNDMDIIKAQRLLTLWVTSILGAVAAVLYIFRLFVLLVEAFVEDLEA